VLGVSTDPAIAIALAKQLPAADRDLASISDEGVWIQESFRAAKTHAYAAPIGAGAGPYQMTAGYEATARALAVERLAVAGARLATLLNEALR
jgi:hypothetical protein